MVLKKGETVNHSFESFISKFNDLSKEDKFKLVSLLIDEINRHHDLTFQEILSGIEAKIPYPIKGKEINIPVGIFSNDALGSLEAIVKYLKEDLKIKFSKIGKLTNRSNKTIWATYHNAFKKMPFSFGAISKDILIPISVFSDRSYSTLECVVGFVKDLEYSNHEVASILHLDDRTIWTVWDRVKKKRGKGA